MQYRERRRPTTFDVLVEYEEGQHRASISDVTQSGARLELDAPGLETEADVRLEVRGKTYPARIVWSRGNNVGVAFTDMLPLDVLGAINRTTRRVQPTKKKRFLMP